MKLFWLLTLALPALGNDFLVNQMNTAGTLENWAEQRRADYKEVMQELQGRHPYKEVLTITGQVKLANLSLAIHRYLLGAQEIPNLGLEKLTPTDLNLLLKFKPDGPYALPQFIPSALITSREIMLQILQTPEIAEDALVRDAFALEREATVANRNEWAFYILAALSKSGREQLLRAVEKHVVPKLSEKMFLRDQSAVDAMAFSVNKLPYLQQPSDKKIDKTEKLIAMEIQALKASIEHGTNMHKALKALAEQEP